MRFSQRYLEIDNASISMNYYISYVAKNYYLFLFKIYFKIYRYLFFIAILTFLRNILPFETYFPPVLLNKSISIIFDVLVENTEFTVDLDPPTKWYTEFPNSHPCNSIARKLNHAHCSLTLPIARKPVHPSIR